MKILKSFEIANTDKRTIEMTGIPSLVLMESAGRSAVQIILQHYPNSEKITVVAGSGNNGGDAVVVARYLAKLGKEVYLFILAENESKLSSDNLKNLEIFKNFGFTYQFITEKNLDILEKNLIQTDLIVDGIFGTGFKPPVKSYRENVIKLINQSKKPVVSIDIPSGLSADTGNIEGEVVKADITITFGYPKICHILYPALQYCGKVYVADISLNPAYAEVERYLITPENLTLPVREKTGHKYTFGHVLVVGGSVGKSGAVIMACRSATKSGSGLTTAIVPDCINQVLETNLIEEMSIPVRSENGMFGENSERILEIIQNGKFSSVVVGMGIGVSKTNQEIIEKLLTIDKPLIIDADGINNLANIENFKEKLSYRNNITVLTPHLGEFSRLTGLSVKDILENYEEIAKEFVISTKSYVVLKFHRMVIFTPDGKIYYSNKGNPGMATAGTGDVLAGMVGALINRLDPENALKLAVYLHGYAGDLAVKDVGEESLKATDIIDYIPKALKNLAEMKSNLKPSLIYELS